MKNFSRWCSRASDNLVDKGFYRGQIFWFARGPTQKDNGWEINCCGKWKGFFDGEVWRGSPVVEFTLTSHVHFSLTCGEAGWGRAYSITVPTLSSWTPGFSNDFAGAWFLLVNIPAAPTSLPSTTMAKPCTFSRQYLHCQSPNHVVESFLKVNLGWEKPRSSTHISPPSFHPLKTKTTTNVVSSPASAMAPTTGQLNSHTVSSSSLATSSRMLNGHKIRPCVPPKGSFLKPDVRRRKFWEGVGWARLYRTRARGVLSFRRIAAVSISSFNSLPFMSFFLAHIYVVLISWTLGQKVYEWQIPSTPDRNNGPDSPNSQYHARLVLHALHWYILALSLRLAERLQETLLFWK